MELSINSDSCFGEFEKIFLVSGLAIEMLNNTILQVVEHSRPRREIRDVIARFLFTIKRINALLVNDGAGEHSLKIHSGDCASTLIEPITPSNNYMNLANRINIVKDLIILKDKLLEIIKCSEHGEIAAFCAILEPRCRLYDEHGGIASDISEQLVKIGVRSVVRVPGQHSICLCGTKSDADFRRAFGELSVASDLNHFVIYEKVSPEPPEEEKWRCGK